MLDAATHRLRLLVPKPLAATGLTSGHWLVLKLEQVQFNVGTSAEQSCTVVTNPSASRLSDRIGFSRPGVLRGSSPSLSKSPETKLIRNLFLSF
jgi:hypothetical protein